MTFDGSIESMNMKKTFQDLLGQRAFLVKYVQCTHVSNHRNFIKIRFYQENIDDKHFIFKQESGLI